MVGFRSLQIINITTWFGARFEHILLKLSNALLILNVISVEFIVITLFAMYRTRTSAEDFIKLVDIK